MPGIAVASPSISLLTPAMIFSSVDLPEPFRPSMPILAPGKKDSEMSFRICRFGGTILPTRFMVKTYWAMGALIVGAGRAAQCHGLGQRPAQTRYCGRLPGRGPAGAEIRRRAVALSCRPAA